MPYPEVEVMLPEVTVRSFTLERLRARRPALTVPPRIWISPVVDAEIAVPEESVAAMVPLYTVRLPLPARSMTDQLVLAPVMRPPPVQSQIVRQPLDM